MHYVYNGKNGSGIGKDARSDDIGEYTYLFVYFYSTYLFDISHCFPSNPNITMHKMNSVKRNNKSKEQKRYICNVT